MNIFLVYRDGGLFETWRGPVVNASNLHYERFYGFTQGEQVPIWVLERTDPPENIVDLEIIRDLTKNELPNYIPASRLTRDEWVKYRWSDVSYMGNPERMISRGMERLPNEAAAALRDWNFLHAND